MRGTRTHFRHQRFPGHSWLPVGHDANRARPARWCQTGSGAPGAFGPWFHATTTFRQNAERAESYQSCFDRCAERQTQTPTHCGLGVRQTWAGRLASTSASLMRRRFPPPRSGRCGCDERLRRPPLGSIIRSSGRHLPLPTPFPFPSHARGVSAKSADGRGGNESCASCGAPVAVRSRLGGAVERTSSAGSHGRCFAWGERGGAAPLVGFLGSRRGVFSPVGRYEEGQRTHLDGRRYRRDDR